MHCSLVENELQLNRESFLKPHWSLVSVRQHLEQVGHTLGRGLSLPSSRTGPRGALRPGLPAGALPTTCPRSMPLCGASRPAAVAGLCRVLSRACEGLPLCAWLHLHPQRLSIPILHMGKMRQREVKELSQGDPASKSQTWNLNLGHLAPKTHICPLY